MPFQNGLVGSYYNSKTISPGNLLFSRVDANIDFYEYGTPAVPAGYSTYAASWAGYILPLYTEEYTFTIDGGNQSDYSNWINNLQGSGLLSVNGQTLINKSQGMDGATATGTISLQAGVFYPILLERTDNNTNFVCGLGWQSQSQSYQIVPSRFLFTSDPTTNNTVPQCGSNTFTADGFDAPAVVIPGQVTWDIVRSGIILASSDEPSGWDVALDDFYFTVSAPCWAPVGDGYEVRYSDGNP